MILFYSLFWMLLAAVSFLPYAAVYYGIYFLLSLPLRRMERARLFINVLEKGLQNGRTPEHTIISLSQSRDLTLGVRFHLLAAHLENGLRLHEALKKVPRFLPPQVQEILATGEEIGDIKKVLPATDRMFRDSVSQTRGALNYFVLVALGFAPILPVFLLMFQIAVLPKWRQIFDGMMASTPVVTEFILGQRGLFAAIVMLVIVSLYCGVAFYIGGPRLTGWLKKVFGPAFIDRFIYRIPWKRKRLQRDFSAMLAILLDSGVPEERAVELAARSTANEVFMRRAEAVRRELALGKKLTDAMEQFDEGGEFRWRLKNAAQGAHGFLPALSGWIEALDAKAFQLEQASAQAVTTFLVLFNGLIVGVTAVGIFQALVSIVNEAALW